MTEEEVIAFCKEQLASFKKSRMVQFVEALPRKTAGKVLKTTLCEMHLQESSESSQFRRRSKTISMLAALAHGFSGKRELA